MASTMLGLSLLMILVSIVVSELCNPEDKKVLLQIKKDLNNPYLLASWDPDTDCCHWYTITCDRKTHRINSLTLFSDTNFTAQIPPSVGLLPYLETLEFHKLPKLTGPIQPAIAKLTNLKFLRISWTNVSGPVPSFLTRLTNLTFLNLSFNNLTGSIPGSLSQLPNLGTLHLDRNHLTGSIPRSFGSFNSSPDIYLSHNNLSGPIPTSLGNLNFTVLDLSRNKLVGDASALFGPNKMVQIVDLSRNQLSFDLTNVEFPASLTSLDLNHNKVYGKLPQGLTALNLQYLNVSYNRLCGQIPVGGKLQSFEVYSYLHNKCLCGSPLPSFHDDETSQYSHSPQERNWQHAVYTFPIALYKFSTLSILIPSKMESTFGLCFLTFLLLSPLAFSELCNPQDKKVLLQIKKDMNNPYLLASWNPDTDCCDWYCVECDSKTHRINSLVMLSSVPDTNLSGYIPPSVGDLPYLETLEFHKLPKLIGPIQPAIAKLTKLKYLTISWTNISGPVPDFLAQLTNLEFIDLSFNNLSGSIPASLSHLQNLLSLGLDRNKLTGPIPDSFGTFKKPGPSIILSHNQLSGPIPASLGNLDPQRIDFSRNKLEGDASVLFGRNKTTQILDVSRNLLEFDLSKVEFATSLISLDLNHNKIYGSIPVGLTAVDFLQGFNVSYNRLCGEIPQGGRLQRFDVYSYFHNKCLCGPPLPSCK
ncbi:receptor-like protein 53 [Abrus precatorius]|uniref:Receptor-like protein 53 n=1 Tax=Abrus precatorius TaxID=3816 RepID=A0A8B8L4G3_ABRPR|nr:receptor-like protein 53 [Abrus precatorius]